MKVIIKIKKINNNLLTDISSLNLVMEIYKKIHKFLDPFYILKGIKFCLNLKFILI